MNRNLVSKIVVTKSAIGAQRRLAAIFCTDVAGYSRLMSGDERGTLCMAALDEIANTVALNGIDIPAPRP
jgi:hypothetical protein